MEEKIAVECKNSELFRKVDKKAAKDLNCSRLHNDWQPGAIIGIGGIGQYQSLTRTFGDSTWYKNNGFKIISAEEYLNEGGKDVSEFKVGDRVEFVRGGKLGDESEEWWRGEFALGGIYIVALMGHKDGDSRTWVRLKEHSYLHHPGHFKLASKTQTIKENKMNKNISEVFDKTKDALLVEKYLGNQIGTTFIDGLMLTDKKTEVLAEAKRLEKEEKDNK